LSFLAELSNANNDDDKADNDNEFDQQQLQTMFQLAVITQEMSNIETSDTSSSSSLSVTSIDSDQDDDEPLNGLDMLLSPDIATTDRTTGGKHSQQSRRRCSLEVSDDEDDDDIPNSNEPPKPNRQSFAANPSPSMPMMMMQRPNSLRDTTSTPATTSSIPKPVLGLQRRNTCGTLYIGSTMSAPDTDDTIQCVCGVVRAHILQSERDGEDMDEDNTHKKYNIFNDQESLQHRHKKSNMHQCQKRGSRILELTPSPPPIPLLQEICTFYRDVFRRAQMETDCIIISLIYVERLIKSTNGAIRPRTTIGVPFYLVAWYWPVKFGMIYRCGMPILARRVPPV
jgi:hypothetical protein